jgi:hypothetical protein
MPPMPHRKCPRHHIPNGAHIGRVLVRNHLLRHKVPSVRREDEARARAGQVTVRAQQHIYHPAIRASSGANCCTRYRTVRAETSTSRSVSRSRTSAVENQVSPVPAHGSDDAACGQRCPANGVSVLSPRPRHSVATAAVPLFRTAPVHQRRESSLLRHSCLFCVGTRGLGPNARGGVSRLMPPSDRKTMVSTGDRDYPERG